ncbi:MAG: IS200/IS605 family transposase [Chloroflexi bacterium]|nr:IS200/IS605 family transposase [Chloroflexota bacterium]
MTVSLLVVTPHPSFGELIRQSLEETQSYRVHVVDDAASAVSCLVEYNCSLAFLDMDLQNASISKIGHLLRQINPELGLVIISGDGTPPAFDDIRPWTLLRKPFYLPDLLNMLGEAPAKEAASLGDMDLVYDSQPDDEKLPWLKDVTRAAQHLTRLTLESSAQAALIVRNGELWAYAGQLPQTAATELAGGTAQYKKEGDLLRFIRLDATQAEHMLYATRLAEGVTLALVFDAETPFSTIRSQANHLAESLSISKPAAASLSDDDDTGPDGIDLPPIAEILAEVPTPDPGEQAGVKEANRRADSPQAEEPDAAQPVPVAETRPSAPLSQTSVFSRESSPAIPLKNLVATEQPVNLETEEAAHREQAVGELDATLPSKARRPATPIRKPNPGELDETRPHSITEVAGRVVLEPSSPGLYNLTYACLLVPRFSSHYLTGDLADHLSEWLPEICIAFGWRLEFLAVRPEYLQWVVNVPPATSPGYLMRIMRQQTSEKIFDNFPRLKKENPSGDFWAPGYLIMGGEQPHPPKLVKDYIQRTRNRQGISRPRH